MKKTLAAVLLALGLLLGLGSVAVGASLVQSSGSSQDKLYVSTCTFAFDTKDSFGRTKPRIVSDSDQACVGVAHVNAPTNNGALNITLDATRRVTAVHVSTGGWLTDNAITCSPAPTVASGGRNVYVDCYRNGTRIKAYGPEMYGKYNQISVTVYAYAG